jgi:basic membrane protein A
MAHDGEEAAKTAGVDVIEELYATTGEPDSAKQDRLQQLIDDGATTVVANGFDYATPMKAVAAANPKVHFAIVDDDSLAKVPNVASLVFSAEQSSFLAGAAAALKTTSKHVAFIGGVDVPLLQTFQAGFDAGVKAVDPSITIDDKYVEESDYAGFNEPDKGQTIAKGLYDAGADIIYAAAGGSGTGVFKAAKSESKLAIGVDSDQYTIPDLADVKSVIMTSAVKNVNIAIYNFVASVAAGSPETGVVSNDLKSGGVGISYSGGAIDDIKSKLDDFTSQIESGTITVPTTLSK